MEQTIPQTLLEVVRHFSDEKRCTDFLASVKWLGEAPACPKCGSMSVTRLATRPVWQCKEKGCRKQFSIKVGTIFEDSLIPLTKWIPFNS